MADKTLGQQFDEYRSTGKYSDEELAKELESQGFSSDDYDLPLVQAEAKAKARLASRNVTPSPPTDMKFSPTASLVTPTGALPTPPPKAPKYDPRAHLKAVLGNLAPDTAATLPSGDVTEVGLPGAPGETADTEARGPSVQDVNLIERIRGGLEGIGEALSRPEETLRAGHAEAKFTTEMANETQSAPSRLVDSLGNIATSVPKMVGALVEPLPVGSSEFRYGKNIGQAFTEGATGGTAYVYTHPVESFKADPVGTLAELTPAGMALGGIAKGLTHLKASERLAGVLPEAVRAVGRVDVGRPLEALAEAVPTRVRQVLRDFREQDTPYESGAAEELSRAGQTQFASEATLAGKDITAPEVASGPALRLQAQQATTMGVPEGQSRKDVLAPMDPSGTAHRFRDPEMAEVLDTWISENPAKVMTPERALAVADELIARTGTEAKSRDIVAKYILDHYTKNPQAPAPVAYTGMGTQKVSKLEPGPSDVQAYQRAHEQDLRAESTRKVAAEMAPEVPGAKHMSEGTTWGDAPELLESAARVAYEEFKKTGVKPPMLANPHDAKQLALAVLRIASAERKPEKALALAHHLESMVPHQGVVVSAGIAKQLALDTNTKVKGFLDKVADWTKQSLTSQGSVGAVNNFMSNFGHYTVNVGNPLTVVKRLATAVEELGQLERGTLPPQKARAYKYWVHSGLLDSTMLGHDVAAVGSSWFGTAGDTARTLLSFGFKKILDKGYKMGDNIFKAADASFHLDAYGDKLAKLEPGRRLELEMSPNVTAIFTSGSDKATLMAGGKKLREIPAEEALFRAAAVPAQHKFQDYSVGPEAIHMSRNASHGLSVVNAFSTYPIKTVDIPLVKKGLLYRMMEPPAPIKFTDSPAIIRDKIMDDMSSSIQRSLFINGMREVLKDETNAEARAAVAYSPSQPKAVLVRALADPNYLSVQKLGNWNFLNASELFSRVVTQAVGYGMGKWEDATTTPEERTAASRKLVSEYKALPALQRRADGSVVEGSFAAANERMEGAVEEYGPSKVAIDPEVAAVLQEMQFVADPEAYIKKMAELRQSVDPAADRTLKSMQDARASVAKMNREQRAELRRAHEFNTKMQTTGFATVDDALNLIQVSGTSITKALEEFREGSKIGQVIPFDRMVGNTILPLVMGGFGKNVVQSVATASWNAGRTDPATRFFKDVKLDDDNDWTEESYLRYVVRKFTGVGWSKMALDRVTGSGVRSFFDKAEAEWLSGLGADDVSLKKLKADQRYQESLGNKDAADKLYAERTQKKMAARVVREEMRLYKDNLKDVLKTVSVGSLPRDATATTPQ